MDSDIHFHSHALAMAELPVEHYRGCNRYKVLCVYLMHSSAVSFLSPSLHPVCVHPLS